jgi:hypothetical protein
LAAAQEVGVIAEKLQGILPFVALLALRFLYVHAFALLFFAGGTAILLQSDRRLRSQVSERLRGRKCVGLSVYSSTVCTAACVQGVQV